MVRRENEKIHWATCMPTHLSTPWLKSNGSEELYPLGQTS